MKAAFRHEFDAILIVRLDRIMRSIANFVILNEKLSAAGVGLICTNQLIDTTTPAGRLQQNILVAFAEYEREIIRERVKDGIARARSEGKKLGRPKVDDSKASERTLRRRAAAANKGGVRFFKYQGGQNLMRQKDFFLTALVTRAQATQDRLEARIRALELETPFSGLRHGPSGRRLPRGYARPRDRARAHGGAMTADARYQLGTGKYRLGRDGIRTAVNLEDRQHQMLEKLRLVKGYTSSEVVQASLEVFLSMPMREIEAKIQERRGRA